MASQSVDTHSSEPDPVQLLPPPSRAMIDPAYDIQDDRILAIVAAHPDVATLLDEIAARSPQYFPEATGLVIRSQEDPEDGSFGWFVVIETPIPADVAARQLHRFDHEWWLAAKPDIEPEFVFTLVLV